MLNQFYYIKMINDVSDRLTWFHEKPGVERLLLVRVCLVLDAVDTVSSVDGRSIPVGNAPKTAS